MAQSEEPPKTLVRFRNGDCPSPIPAGQIHSVVEGTYPQTEILRIGSIEDAVHWSLLPLPDRNDNTIPVFRFKTTGSGPGIQVALKRTYVATPLYGRQVVKAAITKAAICQLIRTDNAAARRIEERREAFGSRTAISQKTGKAVLTAEEYEVNRQKDIKKREDADKKKQSQK